MELVRHLEALGLFAGPVLLQRRGMLGGLLGDTLEVRWVSVTPRYKHTPAGMLCKHQLRMYRKREDGQPYKLLDVLQARGNVSQFPGRAPRPRRRA